MKNKGYTVPELLIVFVVLGIFALIAINKVSYAFVDGDTTREETDKLILIKTSMAYANSIIETLKTNDIYITGKDIKEAGFLVDDENNYANVKIKLSYNRESSSPIVEILK